MSMFKAKLSYDEFLKRAKSYHVPYKFYVRNAEKISMFMQQVIGSASIMFLYWCEVIGDEATLKKIEAELSRESFKQALSFEVPRP